MPEYDATVVYKDIPDKPGYKVGSDGTVWSEWGKQGVPGVKGNVSARTGVWRKLKPERMRDGYYRVNMLGLRVGVHVVVLTSFVGPRPEKMECCHGDGKRWNNQLSNLRWDTKKANQADRKKHGTGTQGELHGEAKLTDEAVRLIRSEYATGGISQSKLAARYGVDQTLIGLVVRRKSWAHVA